MQKESSEFHLKAYFLLLLHRYICAYHIDNSTLENSQLKGDFV